jgi:hypothetical protein
MRSVRALREHTSVEVDKPRWTSASYLLYLGAFTILAAASGAYTYLSSLYGDGAFVGWTLLMLAILVALAGALRRRGPWLAAGLFAYLSVTAFGTFAGALFTWWGWGGARGNGSPFRGWHWLAWLLILIVLAASFAALRAYRFPLLVLTIALLVWFLVTDVVSGGGSWSAVVTLLVGIAYFFVALGLNRVYGFWVHVVSGLLIGGALVYWWHSTTADWWLVVVASLVFVAIGIAVSRSSWAVIGSLGLLAAGVHFSIDWASGGRFGLPTKAWVPIVVGAALGFVFVGLGLLGSRHRRYA